MKDTQIVFYSLLLILFLGCKQKTINTPKPRGYPAINLPKTEYQHNKVDAISFEYSTQAIIEKVNSNKNWFNIVYPKWKATVYCSYLPITPQNLNKALSDSYNLAFSHALKANNINQTLYSNEEHRTSGILYDIDGDVATPVQFFITDSIHHFLRGSFYYDTKVNMDSVAPITEYIRQDIIHLMESLEWK